MIASKTARSRCLTALGWLRTSRTTRRRPIPMARCRWPISSLSTIRITIFATFPISSTTCPGHFMFPSRAELRDPRRCDAAQGGEAKCRSSHYLDPTQTVKQGATIADAVAGSLRQDGPRCAENDPSGAPLNEILKSVARRAPAYEDAAQTIGGRNTHGDKSGRGSPRKARPPAAHDIPAQPKCLCNQQQSA